MIKDLNMKKNLHVKALVVKNQFFGDSVTVTGLLTGRDIIDTLTQNKGDCIYLLPDVLLKHHTDLLLDGVSVAEIAAKSGCDVRITETNGMALVDAVAAIREETI
jgi:NifB/MoaA-like Fe-S oxidoreductase